MTDLDNLFSCFEECNESESTKKTLPDVQSCTSTAVLRKRKQYNENENEPNEKKLKYNPLQDPDINVTDLDPGINFYTIIKNDDCVHEVAVPPYQKFPNLVSFDEPPAKNFKFELDSFQRKAILCVQNKQSVLVSAHTSAGKTAVAEYAIALALKNKQRVIYTTPIKALSNQKYREMLQEFGDVGIMTGDITIDPMASCLIMTTEILRSMLFRGSEITKEVAWVIFDEIHYMKDKARGVIWEETIVMLPNNVRYVFLSATIPNAKQFAAWVCHLHHQPCHVVYTEKRPTPLQYYVFPFNGDDMHLVVDEKGKFIRDEFDKAMMHLRSRSIPLNSTDDDKKTKQPLVTSDTINNVYYVVKILMNKNLTPMILFCFKKSSCESFAVNLSKLNFNTEKEQKLVEEVFSNAINILSDDEKRLPQITKMLPLLKKGIAFHHSGLLPLMKEVVEILFSEGLIKILFATETFAMGLNMPAKTVVFTCLEKFDGQDVRYITSGEFIQMSGRAGRRGLDTNGLVIMMLDEKIPPDLMTQIITGKAAPLTSAFHLTYNMILSLMRQEEINPEYMINKSFFMFQNNARLLELRRSLKTKQKKYTTVHIENEETVAEYSRIVNELEATHNQIREYILKETQILNFLTRGRFVKIKTEEFDYDWGVILGLEKDRAREWIINVLLHVQGDGSNHILPKPDFSKKKGRVAVFPVNHKYIYQLSSLEFDGDLNAKPKLLTKAFLRKVNELKQLYTLGFPLLNPIHDMGICNPILENLISKAQGLERLLSQSPLHTEDSESLLRNFNKKEELSKEIIEILDEIKHLQSFLHMDELEKRKNVLKNLKYCNEVGVISLKGRVACELSCVDELLVSEMIFNGIFSDLPADYCVALLSGLVCVEKSEIDNLSFDRNIFQAKKLIEDIASGIGNIALDCKLITSTDDYTSKCFQPHLVELVLAWCRGASFLDICKMTEIYEGSIIRYLKILEEVLKQTCKAATNVGNIDLENRFSEGIRLLKRGVVFAGSLYL